jgi:CBS domain-containing protein
MKLKELCILDVACCTPDADIQAAARSMRQHHTGTLVVIDDEDDERYPVGIITDRDIVIEVIAKGLDPAATKVGDVMTTALVVASAAEDPMTALNRMREHGVRRVPVLDDEERLLGIVTLDDLLRAHAEEGSALAAVLAKEQVREQRNRRPRS